MPITDTYIYSKRALNRLQRINITEIQSVILSLDSETAQIYKELIKAAIQREVDLALNDSLILSLSGAVESDQKNSLLTPIIAATIVNPAAASNAIEQAALIADGVDTAQQLTTFLNSAFQILS